MTCRHDVKRVTIDPSLVGDDRDMLEDLIAAAFNDAVRRVEVGRAADDGEQRPSGADERRQPKPGSRRRQVRPSCRRRRRSRSGRALVT